MCWNFSPLSFVSFFPEKKQAFVVLGDSKHISACIGTYFCGTALSLSSSVSQYLSNTLIGYMCLSHKKCTDTGKNEWVVWILYLSICRWRKQMVYLVQFTNEWAIHSNDNGEDSSAISYMHECSPVCLACIYGSHVQTKQMVELVVHHMILWYCRTHKVQVLWVCSPYRMHPLQKVGWIVLQACTDVRLIVICAVDDSRRLSLLVLVHVLTLIQKDNCSACAFRSPWKHCIYK